MSATNTQPSRRALRQVPEFPPVDPHQNATQVGDCSSQGSAAGAHRRRKLLETRIDFVPNRTFLDPSVVAQIEADGKEMAGEAVHDAKVPRDLPAHLARLVKSRLLSAEEETRLFRRMNFLKFTAASQLEKLTTDDDCRALDRVERSLEEAQAIRDRIVQSNLRLVISVVKKFVTPQDSFDDMLSDGTCALMQAAEKFDYDRGFRFSTYAYRAIARCCYRANLDRRKDNARYVANPEGVAFDVVDKCGSSSAYDAAWDRMRRLLMQLMGQLDRRERFILRCRYALGAHRKAKTFQFLAEKLGVSKERARQLEQRAIAKLQTLAAAAEKVSGTFSAL